MLDSNVSRSFPEIHCVFCPRKVRLEICQPRWGHAAEDISDLPPYINLPIGVMMGKEEWLLATGRMFKMINGEEKCELTEFRLSQHSSPYAYGNPVAPSFGFGNDKVLWVCESCWKITDSEEETLKALRVKDAMWYRLYEERGLIVCESAGA